MKIFILSLILLALMAGIPFADDQDKPNLIFNQDSCMLRITPHSSIDMSEYLIDCGEALSNPQLNFDALKSYYK